MIQANLKDAEKYASLYPGFREALEALAGYKEDTALGKHLLRGEELFANVQAYDSKAPADAKFENHHRYIDIQYMISGREKIRVTERDLTLIEPYHEDGDYELFSMTENYTELDMREGDFAILFPGEPHAPGIRYDGETAEPVHKVVVKVKVVSE